MTSLFSHEAIESPTALCAKKPDRTCGTASASLIHRRHRHSVSSSLAKVRECLGQRIELKQVAPMLLQYLVKSTQRDKFPTKVPTSTQESQQNRCASFLGQPQTSVSGCRSKQKQVLCTWQAPSWLFSCNMFVPIFSTYLQSPLRVVLGPLRGDFPSPLTLAERKCKPTC